MVEHVNDDNFEKKINVDGVVVLDVYAEWCGPCKMLAPIIEELGSGDDNSDFKVFKLDSDKNKKTIEKYNITGLPTILFFKNGILKDKHVGFTTIDNLKGKINSIK